MFYLICFICILLYLILINLLIITQLLMIFCSQYFWYFEIFIKQITYEAFLVCILNNIFMKNEVNKESYFNFLSENSS